MYISVDSYREMYLLGKDFKTVNEEIEKIRREIAKTKKKLESPANLYDLRTRLTEGVAIEVYKGYLSAAMDYLSDITDSRAELTEEEKASLIFDSTVDDICCVTLTAGRYLQDKYELTFEEGTAQICEIHLGEDSVCRAVDPLASREAIRSLHLGEWRESYTPAQYGCTLNEPTRWQIRVDYKNGSAPRFFDGTGVFPYNFYTLVRLFGADIS